MPRESLAAKRARAVEVCRRMDDLFPEAECALHFSDPFSLVIAVLLSAQTTDAAVNKVTPVLFDRWPTPADLAGAPLPEVEEILHPLGFFRSKARHVVECAQMVVSDFGGEVPRTMAELTRLPGVGRKTANIVLNNPFGIVEGIAVDTHVFRIATRSRTCSSSSPASCGNPSTTSGCSSAARCATRASRRVSRRMPERRQRHRADCLAPWPTCARAAASRPRRRRRPARLRARRRPVRQRRQERRRRRARNKAMRDHGGRGNPARKRAGRVDVAAAWAWPCGLGMAAQPGRIQTRP